MRPLRHPLVVSATAGLFLASSVSTFAQQDSGQAPDAQIREPSQAARQQQNAIERDQAQLTGNAIADADLAACLIVDNNKAVALARLAQQKSQHGQVQQFAEQVIKDHQEFIQKLQQIATVGGYSEQQLSVDRSSGPADQRLDSTRSAGSKTDEVLSQSNEGNGPTERRAARGGELDADNAAGLVDFISLKREVAETCVQSVRQELDQVDEAEFDVHYMASQDIAHKAMMGTLEVFARHASDELRQILEEGHQIAQAHYEQAKQITAQLPQPSAEDRQEPQERPSK